jgi:hypothetical protein
VDDTLKQHILALALAGAERNRLVYTVEQELLRESWAADLDMHRTIKRPLREIEHELQPQAFLVPTKILCRSHPDPVGAIEDVQPTARRPPIVILDMGTWADSRGPSHHVWLGQCRECRTIWWRIQEA